MNATTFLPGTTPHASSSGYPHGDRLYAQNSSPSISFVGVGPELRSNLPLGHYVAGDTTIPSRYIRDENTRVERVTLRQGGRRPRTGTGAEQRSQDSVQRPNTTLSFVGQPHAWETSWWDLSQSDEGSNDRTAKHCEATGGDTKTHGSNWRE